MKEQRGDERGRGRRVRIFGEKRKKEKKKVHPERKIGEEAGV